LHRSGDFYGNALLSRADQQVLFNRSIHQAQDNFINHPVTRFTVNSLLFVATGGIEGAFALGNIGKNISNFQLVYRAGAKAFKNIPGNGHVIGSKRHSYATKLLIRYQGRFGDKGLRFGVRSYDGKAILDVLDTRNNVIYDWKFGAKARLSQAQYLKYKYYFKAETIPLYYK